MLQLPVNKAKNENIELKNQIAILLAKIDELTNEIACLKNKIGLLRDEIAILKKQKPRPKIPPNKLEKPNDKNGKNENQGGIGKENRRKKTTNNLKIHERIRLKPESVPEGAVFKGVQKYTVQDIRFESFNVLYERERWVLPDGTYLTGKLPDEIDGHYGHELKAYILHQHFVCRVTEPLLLEGLRTLGVLISAGQLNRILLDNKEIFHQEKKEILAAGIEATGHIKVDDIGARHAGKNAYTTIIGNELFAYFSTSSSKSRINFLQVLHGGDTKYLFNEDTWAYIQEQKPDSLLRKWLEKDCPKEPKEQKAFDDFLKGKGIESKKNIRLITEAALFANLIERGVPRDLGIHADDAGQFAVFYSSLCWIHEERHYRKFQVYHEETAKVIEKVREQIWHLYRGLKSYKEGPSESERIRLAQEFDQVFLQKTSFPLLNERLSMTHKKKKRLLMVLEDPRTPLHNNATETDGRSGVIIKKISGGTRSEEGKDIRDTFLSLKQTARKLGINFLSYLKDRLSGINKIPRFSDIIRDGGIQPSAP